MALCRGHNVGQEITIQESTSKPAKGRKWVGGKGKWARIYDGLCSKPQPGQFESAKGILEKVHLEMGFERGEIQ